MADPYRLPQTGPAQADHRALSPSRDDRRGRRHLGEYDSRSRTAVMPLLLMKSLDRIEAFMRAGTADAFQSAQQELRAMAKIMRDGAARTDQEASRREKLLELLDLVERRVSGMAAKHASAAEGFAPFRAATSRTGAGTAETFTVAMQGRARIEPRKIERVVDEPAANLEMAQRLMDDSAYVPFEMEVQGEPLSVPREEARGYVHAPAKTMPKTSHSVTERMAASEILPALAELTEEERLALFT